MKPSTAYPSRNVVDQCLAEIEREDWEQKEALRRFYAREGKIRKVPLPIKPGTFFTAMLTCAVIVVGVLVVIFR